MKLIKILFGCALLFATSSAVFAAPLTNGDSIMNIKKNTSHPTQDPVWQPRKNASRD